MPPPLPPTAVGHCLSNAAAPIRIELFLDLICPFSCKMWRAVSAILPQIGDKFCFVMHQVPQPWHPQGTCVHEAALAVKQVAPTAYAAYVSAIYDAFDGADKKFTDSDTQDKTRKQIFQDLYALLSTSDELKAVDAVAVGAKLALKDGTGARNAGATSACGHVSPHVDCMRMAGNVGCEMTQHIKWICKHHRTRGVRKRPASATLPVAKTTPTRTL